MKVSVLRVNEQNLNMELEASDLEVKGIERDSTGFVTVYLSDRYYLILDQEVIDKLKSV